MDHPKLDPGIYRHFKGNLYEVIGVARKVDTSEAFVIYRPLYGEIELVARPLEDFTAMVPHEMGEEPRFQLVDPSGGACHCHRDQASKSF
jgi:hypothetical protein